jgi:hypothetical protein
MNRYLTTGTSSMSEIMNDTVSHCNNYLPSLVNHPSVRTYFPPPRFADLNAQKRTWLKSKIKECKLRLNEPRVLEALVFLTNTDGEGTPSIEAIRQKFMESGGSIEDKAIRENLKRIRKKGCIDYYERYNSSKGKFKDSNFYRLIDFKYKLVNHSVDSTDNLNSSDLTDHTNNQPLREAVKIKNANLQEALQEYEAFNKSLAQKTHNARKPAPHRINAYSANSAPRKKTLEEALEELTKKLPNAITMRVCQQAREYARKITIDSPMAVVRKIIDREMTKPSKEKAQQELFRRQAQEEIERTQFKSDERENGARSLKEIMEQLTIRNDLTRN